MKRLSILGSTGSIGTQTLDIVRASKDIEVVALSCGKNIDLFEKQIREFKPKFASIENEELAKDLNINSIELADLILLCEDKFGIEINEDDTNKFITVGDVVNYLESL